MEPEMTIFEFIKALRNFEETNGIYLNVDLGGDLKNQELRIYVDSVDNAELLKEAPEMVLCDVDQFVYAPFGELKVAKALGLIHTQVCEAAKFHSGKPL